MPDPQLPKTLTNEDRLILAETFAERAERHLAPQGAADHDAAVTDARSLCESVGIPVVSAPNAVVPASERLILAYGYAIRTRKALGGRRVRDLPRFIEGLCQNLGLQVESADDGVHIRSLIEHVELNLLD